jgi:hypothetical protein
MRVVLYAAKDATGVTEGSKGNVGPFENGRSKPAYKHWLLAMLEEFLALGKLEILQQSLAVKFQQRYQKPHGSLEVYSAQNSSIFLSKPTATGFARPMSMVSGWTRSST